MKKNLLGKIQSSPQGPPLHEGPQTVQVDAGWVLQIQS